jgi:hypothetical protein
MTIFRMLCQFSMVNSQLSFWGSYAAGRTRAGASCNFQNSPPSFAQIWTILPSTLCVPWQGRFGQRTVVEPLVSYIALSMQPHSHCQTITESMWGLLIMKGLLAFHIVGLCGHRGNDLITSSRFGRRRLQAILDECSPSSCGVC